MPQSSDPPPVRSRRFPDSLYATGKEPDPRFTLANERTFLAWIRTALALTAGGVALEALGLNVLQPELRTAASITLISGGILAPIQAWWGWKRTERALRLDLPLPRPRLAPPTVLLVLAAAALMAIAVVAR